MKKSLYIFFNIILIILSISCTKYDKNHLGYMGQIHISHIGEQDKPIREFFIYTAMDTIMFSSHPLWMKKYSISDTLFQKLEKFIVNNKINKEKLRDYRWGTFEITVNSQKDSLSYILENEQIVSYFSDFINLIDDNSILKEDIKSEILDKFQH